MLEKLKLVDPEVTDEDKMHNKVVKTMDLKSHEDFMLKFLGEKMIHDSH